jgi:hypothetical protein
MWRDIAGSKLANLERAAGTAAFRRDVAPRLLTILVLVVATFSFMHSSDIASCPFRPKDP